MISSRSPCLMLLLLLVSIRGSVVGAEDKDAAKEFYQAQRTIRMQLKAKRADVRVAAIRRLGAYPVVEAAKILVQQGLGSEEDEICRAAFETLLKFRDDPEVCRYLQETVATHLKKGDLGAGAFGPLGVLLAAESADVRKQAAESLTQIAEAGESGVTLLVMLADALGSQGDDASLRSLLMLTNSAPFTSHFALRRAVVQNLTLIRKPEAVTALVSILSTTTGGEIRADIVQYLISISGRQLGLEAKAWSDWWQASQADFQFPAAAAGNVIARAAFAPGGTPAYYGLPLYGARLIFVLDTSGSMRGPRLDAAKRELIQAIGGLPEGVNFNVLVFNSQVAAWQRRLVPSSQENKQAAALYVMAQQPASQTASYDALEAALSFDAESIYFLTDGAPYGGKITQPAQIVAALSKINRVRRVTINSIGIGVGAPGNPFDTFLRTLSAQNFGEYRRIDN